MLRFCRILSIFPTNFFLVACTRLYTPLCPSVHPSVCPYIRPSVCPSHFFFINFISLSHLKSFKSILSHSKSICKSRTRLRCWPCYFQKSKNFLRSQNGKKVCIQHVEHSLDSWNCVIVWTLNSKILSQLCHCWDTQFKDFVTFIWF